jgi:CheY-like chemotaxis protein
VQIEALDINKILKETLLLSQKETLCRNIVATLDLAQNLPRIASDRGQLQQVFLNILNNAFAAVQDGGSVSVTSRVNSFDTVAVSKKDNGCRMSEETLNSIEKCSPDLVLLDMILPGMSGLEVLRRLKGERPNLQVIMLSGLGGTRDAMHGMRLGAFDHLMKPVNISELIAKVRSAVEF